MSPGEALGVACAGALVWALLVLKAVSFTAGVISPLLNV